MAERRRRGAGAGAAAITDRVLSGEGPLRLLLGSGARSCATAKAAALRENLRAAALGTPLTDFPAAA